MRREVSSANKEPARISAPATNSVSYGSSTTFSRELAALRWASGCGLTGEHAFELSYADALRQLTARHYGYYVPAQEIRASLMKAGAVLD